MVVMKEISPHIKELIEGKPIALATTKKGKPHVIAITCYKVIGKNKILLCDTYMKTTLENIQDNSNVALVAWDKNYEGYQFSGKCKYFSEGKWFQLCKKLKAKKGLACKGALLVEISKIARSTNRR